MGGAAERRDWTRHCFSEGGFSVEIPGDWVPILEMHMVALAEGATTRWVAAGGTPNRGFRNGFQQGPVQKWFHPPFVTFDIRRSGRMPWRALAGLPSVESGAAVIQGTS